MRSHSVPLSLQRPAKRSRSSLEHTALSRTYLAELWRAEEWGPPPFDVEAMFIEKMESLKRAFKNFCALYIIELAFGRSPNTRDAVLFFLSDHRLQNLLAESLTDEVEGTDEAWFAYVSTDDFGTVAKELAKDILDADRPSRWNARVKESFRSLDNFYRKGSYLFVEIMAGLRHGGILVLKDPSAGTWLTLSDLTPYDNDAAGQWFQGTLTKYSCFTFDGQARKAFYQATTYENSKLDKSRFYDYGVRPGTRVELDTWDAHIVTRNFIVKWSAECQAFEAAPSRGMLDAEPHYDILDHNDQKVIRDLELSQWVYHGLYNVAELSAVVSKYIPVAACSNLVVGYLATVAPMWRVDGEVGHDLNVRSLVSASDVTHPQRAAVTHAQTLPPGHDLLLLTNAYDLHAIATSLWPQTQGTVAGVSTVSTDTPPLEDRGVRLELDFPCTKGHIHYVPGTIKLSIRGMPFPYPLFSWNKEWETLHDEVKMRNHRWVFSDHKGDVARGNPPLERAEVMSRLGEVYPEFLSGQTGGVSPDSATVVQALRRWTWKPHKTPWNGTFPAL